MLKKLVLAAAALASLATATITMSGSAEARDCRKWQCHRQFHFRENNWQDQYQPYYNDGTYLRGGGFFGGPGIFLAHPFHSMATKSTGTATTVTVGYTASGTTTT